MKLVELKGLNRLGAGSLIGSGLLFMGRGILDFVAGTPPSSGLKILIWSASHRAILAFENELLFFAALLLVPALIALCRGFVAKRRAVAITACGIFAVAVPILAVLDIIHGRLIYPVFGISAHTPEVAEFIVAIFYGGLHAVGIMMGIATIMLSICMRGGAFGKPVVILGLVTGVLDIVGAYPFLIGPIPTLICGAFFAAWFIAVGWRLWVIDSQGSGM